jgi:hypothetical protein
MKITRRFVSWFVLIALAVSIGTVAAPAPAIAQENQVLQPIGSEVPTDPALKDLVWNRYTSKNFVIMSIDNAQGKWMSENIDNIKTWCIERWGFPDFQFTKECRIFCVPNKALFKKLFNLDDSKVEIRRKGGTIEITAMWLVLDDKPARVIPKQLTKICFAEFEQKHNVVLPFFAKNGMALLNGTIPDIRTDMVYLGGHVQKDQPIFVSEKMFSMTEEEYEKSSAENKRIFDCQSVALCLLLRKEFGEAKMQGFLRMSARNSPKDVLLAVYGFTSYSQFDQSYLRYMKDLSREVSGSRTPDTYLEIRPVKR